MIMRLACLTQCQNTDDARLLTAHGTASRISSILKCSLGL